MLSELDLHVTNRCTIQCDYCCFSSNRKQLVELSTDEFKKVMSDAVSMGCKHVHFTGGEPLLRADIGELIYHANSLGLKIRMQTNGMLLTTEVANQLSSLGLESVMISLDSWDEQIHDAIRGTGTWKKAIAAIKTAKNIGLKVRVNSVLTQKNMNSIFETAKYVKSLGVKDYSAFYFSPIGCGKDRRDLWIPPIEYFRYWNNLQRKIESEKSLCDMNIVIEKGYASWEEAKNLEIDGFTGCGGGCLNTFKNRDYLIVRCDGNVYPCIMAVENEPLGNVKEKELREIYVSSSEWNKLLPANVQECKDCIHMDLCGEGCRYYPKHSTCSHDSRCIMNELVPLCPIMKYNFKNNRFGGSSDDVME